MPLERNNPFQAQDAILPRLLADNHLTDTIKNQAERRAAVSTPNRGAVYELLTDKKLRPETVLPYLAAYFAVTAQDSSDIDDVPHEVRTVFDRAQIVSMGCLPYRIDPFARTVNVVMVNPHDAETISTVSMELGLDLNISVLDGKSFLETVNLYYPQSHTTEALDAGLLKTISATDQQAQRISVAEMARQEQISNSDPVVFLDRIFNDAIARRVSDIHIEPYFEGTGTRATATRSANGIRIRYRVDGSLVVVYKKKNPAIPPEAIVARAKVLADLNITETQLPQDGKYTHSIPTEDGHQRLVDFRVSSLPVTGGEKIVFRILDRASIQLDMSILGFNEREADIVAQEIDNPHGVILLTGPTGSGKTTTLYTMLSMLNKPDTNIMTAEDPVEYELEGINQVSVNNKKGLTFQIALKAFLRQDPDIIMLGEIRDKATAGTALEAAMTGHLVLSTLHTNDAPSSISRLKSLGADVFEAAHSLRMIIAQRLLRRVCQNCRATYTPSTRDLTRLGLSHEEVDRWDLVQGQGCDACFKSGYAGRVGVYEILRISPKLRDMIVSDAADNDLRSLAIQEGMATLRMSALDKARQGHTSLEEVIRNTVI